MIDNFSLFVTHSLLLIAAWRLIFRNDLDREAAPNEDHDRGPDARPDERRWGKRDA